MARSSTVGRADPALVGEVFVATERRVGQRGPVHAQQDVRLRTADGAGAAGHARWAALGVAAVVAEEEDQRVFQQAALLQARDEPAHAVVQAVDHRGVDRHDPSVPGRSNSLGK